MLNWSLSGSWHREGIPCVTTHPPHRENPQSSQTRFGEPRRGPPSLTREGFPKKPYFFHTHRFNFALWCIEKLDFLCEPSLVREGVAQRQRRATDE